jgi:hypothetical protein
MTPTPRQPALHLHLKYQELKKYSSTIGDLVFMNNILGIDLASLPLDQELSGSDSTTAHRVISQLGCLNTESDVKMTARMIAERVLVGRLAPLITECPATVTDGLERWLRGAGIDGSLLCMPQRPVLSRMLLIFWSLNYASRGIWKGRRVPHRSREGICKRTRQFVRRSCWKYLQIRYL